MHEPLKALALSVFFSSKQHHLKAYRKLDSYRVIRANAIGILADGAHQVTGLTLKRQVWRVVNNGQPNVIEKLTNFFDKARHGVNAFMRIAELVDLIEDVLKTDGGGWSFPFLISIFIAPLKFAANTACTASRAAGTQARQPSMLERPS